MPTCRVSRCRAHCRGLCDSPPQAAPCTRVLGKAPPPPSSNLPEKRPACESPPAALPIPPSDRVHLCSAAVSLVLAASRDHRDAALSARAEPASANHEGGIEISTRNQRPLRLAPPASAPDSQHSPSLCTRRWRGRQARTPDRAPPPCIFLHHPVDASALCRLYPLARGCREASQGLVAGLQLQRTPLQGFGGRWR